MQLSDLTSIRAKLNILLLLQLVASLGHTIQVTLDAGDGRGKGVIATQDYNVGDIIFTERPLVRSAVHGAQRSSLQQSSVLQLSIPPASG